MNEAKSQLPDSDGLSLERELEHHQTLLSICEEWSKQKRPHASVASNTVVPQKPMHLEEARGRVRPEDFERMKTLSPDGTGFFMFRRVWRDAIIDALTNKATVTKMSIASLATGGFGADAFALTRHLFENVIVVAWLLRPTDEAERAKRIDTYAAHFEAFKVRLDQVRRTLAASIGEDASPSEVADLRTKEIATEVFQDKWMQWASFRSDTGKQTFVRLSDMADEIGFRLLYDTDYFEMCAFVHSAPASIFGAGDEEGPAEVSRDRGYFCIDPAVFRAPGFALRALALSNVYFLHLLIELNAAFKFGWDGSAIARQGEKERQNTATTSKGEEV